MTIPFRISLVVASIMMVAIVVLRIRKSKFQIHDGLFWFLFSILLLVMSIFPSAVVWVSSLLGIQSAVNFVFLCIIALLIIKVFYQSIRVSILEFKLVQLAQQIALEKVDSERSEKE